MLSRIAVLKPIILKIICVFFILSVCSCGDNPESGKKSTSPAKVKNAIKETKLTTITLTNKAEERLGIKTFAVIKKNISPSMIAGGEIIAVPGSEVRIASPVAGTILKPERGAVLLAGKMVKKGEKIIRLLILPPQKNLLGAKEEVLVRKEQLQVAQAKVDRAKKLITSKAISEKKYQQILVEYTQANAAWKAANARLDLLTGSNINKAARNLSTLELESPIDGVLKKIYVAPGQTVPAATVLFEVADLDPLWVRVPVYMGDLAKIDLQKSARIKLLGQSSYSNLIIAKPVKGPPLSDASSVSADLYYEISNLNSDFRIGQKVSVLLWQKSTKDRLVIPQSAVLYDIYGSNWVYTKITANTYTRQRVEVSHVDNNYAVVIRGLNEGDMVVTDGAAEIFGTEFGVGK